MCSSDLESDSDPDSSDESQDEDSVDIDGLCLVKTLDHIDGCALEEIEKKKRELIPN